MDPPGDDGVVEIAGNAVAVIRVVLHVGPCSPPPGRYRSKFCSKSRAARHTIPPWPDQRSLICSLMSNTSTDHLRRGFAGLVDLPDMSRLRQESRQHAQLQTRCRWPARTGHIPIRATGSRTGPCEGPVVNQAGVARIGPGDLFFVIDGLAATPGTARSSGFSTVRHHRHLRHTCWRVPGGAGLADRGPSGPPSGRHD